VIGKGEIGIIRTKKVYLIYSNSLFSLSLFLLYLCPTNETTAAAAMAAAAMLGATGGQVQPMSAVNIGALSGGGGGPQMMASPFGMIGTAPRFRWQGAVDLLGLQSQQQPGNIAAQAAAAAQAAVIQTSSSGSVTASSAATINAIEALQKQQAVQVSTAQAAVAQQAAVQAVAQAQGLPSVNGNNPAFSNSSTTTTHTTNATTGLLSFPTSHQQVVASGSTSNPLLSHPTQAGQSSLLGAMIARASGAPLLAQSSQPQANIHAGMLAAHQQQQMLAAMQAQAQAQANAAAVGNSNQLAIAALQAQQNHPILAQNAAAQMAQMAQVQQAAAAQVAAQNAAAQAGASGNAVAAMTPQGLILLPRQ